MRLQVSGDSGNDAELFMVRGVRGCVVANAHPELREFVAKQAHAGGLRLEGPGVQRQQLRPAETTSGPPAEDEAQAAPVWAQAAKVEGAVVGGATLRPHHCCAFLVSWKGWGGGGGEGGRRRGLASEGLRTHACGRGCTPVTMAGPVRPVHLNSPAALRT